MLTEWINTNPNSAVAIIVAIMLLVLSMVVIIAWQYRKLRVLEYRLKPKTGFLGKTIVPIMVLGLLGGTVFLLQYSTGQDLNQTANANLELEIDYEIIVLEKDGEDYEVEFKSIPLINGEAWGDMTFDVFWTVTGERNFSYLQLGASADDDKKFTKLLPAGEYQIQININTKEKLFERVIEYVLR